MQIDKEIIKRLRARTEAGIMDCKKALKEAKGNLEKAMELLRQKGIARAFKKANRITKQGLVTSYVHLDNKIGALVEINCETDFVARNSEFREFARDIALQVVASSPSYVKREDVTPEVISREKITPAETEEYYQKVCLLEQPFIKNPQITVKDYLTSVIAKIGENIVIRRFVRFQLGEEI
jgi:elongation factor Ts